MLFKSRCSSSGCPSKREKIASSPPKLIQCKITEANRRTALGPNEKKNRNSTLYHPHRSYYTRRKFRPIYAKVMNSYANACRKSSTYQYQRYAGANSLSLVTGLLPFTSEMALFEFPFNELLVSGYILQGFQINHPPRCPAAAACLDLGCADQAATDGPADVDTRRGGSGQVTGGLQTLQGHGPRSGRGRSGH